MLLFSSLVFFLLSCSFRLLVLAYFTCIAGFLLSFDRMMPVFNPTGSYGNKDRQCEQKQDRESSHLDCNMSMWARRYRKETRFDGRTALGPKGHWEIGHRGVVKVQGARCDQEKRYFGGQNGVPDGWFFVFFLLSSFFSGFLFFCSSSASSSICCLYLCYLLFITHYALRLLLVALVELVVCVENVPGHAVEFVYFVVSVLLLCPSSISIKIISIILKYQMPCRASLSVCVVPCLEEEVLLQPSLVVFFSG